MYIHVCRLCGELCMVLCGLCMLFFVCGLCILFFVCCSLEFDLWIRSDSVKRYGFVEQAHILHFVVVDCIVVYIVCLWIVQTFVFVLQLLPHILLHINTMVIIKNYS